MKNISIISIYFALVLSTLLVFRQVRNFDYVDYDDDVYIYKNPHILNGLTADGIIWAFTTPHTGNWLPLTWLSLMLNCQLFGPNPGWMHLINLLLHLTNTLLLFAVLKKMTGALWPSAFVAAAFALHPMHVESVAWIAERKDVLSTFFLLLTLAAYVSYVRRRGLVRYLLTVLLFAAGLLAKPMLVTLPFLFLLLDYWPLNRIKNFDSRVIYHLVLEKIPFFALAAVWSVITFIVQKGSGAVPDINTFSLQIRVANAFLSYAKYIGKMFWPQDLAIFYPFGAGTIQSRQAVLCALLMIVVSVLAIRFGRKQKYLFVGWFWFVGTLMPVIGLVQSGAQSLADRYTYIPYIGLFIIIAWGLPELLSKWLSAHSTGSTSSPQAGSGQASSVESPYRKIALGLSMVIVLTTLGICAQGQVHYWNNSIALFSHAIEVTQNNYIAYNTLGVAYGRLGRYQDEIESYKQAIRIRPDFANAHYNLGTAYGRLGRYQDELEAYKQAIRIKPDYAEAYNNLGAAYGGLGRYQDEIEAYKQAIRIKPDFAEAYNNLGVAYGGLGRYQDEIEAYKQAIRIEPDDAEAYNNLGVAYGGLGRYQDEIESHKQAIRIKPDFAEAHNTLGVAYGRLGRYEDAVEAFKQAIRIKPDFAEAHFNLGVAYGRLGRHQDAVEAFKQAVRIKPDDANAHSNLGSAYFLTGDKGSALEEYKILKTLDAELANKLFNLINK